MTAARRHCRRGDIVSGTSIHRHRASEARQTRAGLAQAVIDIESALPPGEVLEKLTLRSANAWGIGRKGVNDGLVIFVFMQDRKLRIEIGRGLESAISNAAAKTIVDEQLTPAFRQRKYADGLAKAIRELRELLLRRSHGG